MTNYNQRLDEILTKLENSWWNRDVREGMFGDNLVKPDAKQAITSLIKELVAEAKPELPTLFAGLDDISVIMYKKGTDEFEQNILKALEEV